MLNKGLPEKLIAPCLDVLRILASSEREFIRMVVETVEDLRDVVYNEEAEVAKAEVCLSVSVIMLTGILTVTNPLG